MQPLMFGGRRYWGIKDPVSLRYFQLREEEYGILTMLDGETSLEEIKGRFEREFVPRRVSLRQLQAFLATLHQDGLIVADTPGQGEELLARGNKQQRREWLNAFSNVLALRFRGFDPEPMLRVLLPWTRPLFSLWFLALCGMLVLSAVALVTVRYDTLQAKLPDFQAFFTLRNAFWIAVAIAFTKVLHELGHALACKRFGGECHEMGVMLLVFTPCLYCNVSDAWMLPNKWQRVAIGAAGMIVELTLAAVCTWLWWFSEPGLFNSLCLDLMFVCSVGTLLFNGNPLLRYDGYYILSDIIEVPNLQQQADALLRGTLAQWILGIDLVNERMLPDRHRGLLTVYAAASWIYRWFVVFAVLWFTYKVLKPYRLEVIAELLGVIVLARLLVMPVWRGGNFLLEQWGNPEMNWRRAMAAGTVLAGIVAAACFIPLPHRIHAPIVIEAEGARRVYVSVAGTLVRSTPVGTVVEKDQTLAELKNLDVDMEVEKLRGQANQQRLHIANLERRRVADPAAGALLPTAQETLADIEERLKQRTLDQERLTLKSPVAGTVLPPPRQVRKKSDKELVPWSGTPIEEKNLGSFLDTGTTLCLIGDPQQLEALLVIDQSDVEFVRTGQRVHIQLDESPGETLWGTIAEVGELDLDVTPRELLHHGDIPTQADEKGVLRPLTTWYQARVTLVGPVEESGKRSILLGATGRAKIHVPSQPLAARIYRALRNTFHFDL